MNGFEVDAVDDTVDDAALDRLVEGELTETARRELLMQLDAMPDGWRRCALAFLEAQAWRTALSPMVVGSALEMTAAVELKLNSAASVAVCPQIKSERRRFVGRSIAWAACLCVGFVSGMIWRGESQLSTPQIVAKAEPSEVREADAVEPTSNPTATQMPVADGKFPEYVRTQLERRGYQIVQKPRLLPVEIEPGRTVFVPVSRMELHKDVAARIF